MNDDATRATFDLLVGYTVAQSSTVVVAPQNTAYMIGQGGFVVFECSINRAATSTVLYWDFTDTAGATTRVTTGSRVCGHKRLCLRFSINRFGGMYNLAIRNLVDLTTAGRYSCSSSGDPPAQASAQLIMMGKSLFSHAL